MSKRSIGSLAVVAALLVIAAGTALSSRRSASAAPVMHQESHPQSTWAPCNRHAHSDRPSTFRPLSDAVAAALVTQEPETRPDNDKGYTFGGHHYPAPNYYVPTRAQISQFVHSRLSTGQTNTQFNPYYDYVDGLDGMHHPSTDDLIQWAAHKWGIPENWLRAEYVHESYWNQFMLGDSTPVSAAAYSRYPAFSRVSGGQNAYQSLGITQVRWVPGNSLHPGTEPLRWLSTAFNVDYQAATIRFYYDNPQNSRSAWGDASYEPCQKWSSIGGWFRPYPWGNPGQATYVSAVQQILAGQVWTTSSFLSWSPPALPPGVELKVDSVVRSFRRHFGTLWATGNVYDTGSTHRLLARAATAQRQEASLITVCAGCQNSVAAVFARPRSYDRRGHVDVRSDGRKRIMRADHSNSRKNGMPWTR